MENLENLKKTITQEERKNILSMFKQALKERSNIIKDLRNSNINNTIDQACFISSGFNGIADGIFFPNSEMAYLNSKKEFICLCIYDGEPSICLNYPDDPIFKSFKNQYYFISLESIIYNREELERRKEIKNYISNYENKMQLLKSIYRVYKKDGSDFQNFFKNFDSKLKYFSMNFDGSSRVDIYASELLENGFYKRYNDTIYLSGSGFTTENITASQFMYLINEDIEKYKKYIDEYNKKLNTLHDEALKIEKIFNDLKNKKDQFINKDFFRKYIESNISELSK